MELGQAADLKGLNPLYTEHPKVFWVLFDADEPTVETLLREFPSMSKSTAQTMLDYWNGSSTIESFKSKTQTQGETK